MKVSPLEKKPSFFIFQKKRCSMGSFRTLDNFKAIPVELRRAHQANDKEVMEAYDMTKIVDRKKTWLTESETVARLFEMYEEMTK